MTIREAANNTTTGGISAAASSGGSGLTEAQVITLADAAILANMENNSQYQLISSRTWGSTEYDATYASPIQLITAIDFEKTASYKIIIEALNSSSSSGKPFFKLLLDGNQIGQVYTGYKALYGSSSQTTGSENNSTSVIQPTKNWNSISTQGKANIRVCEIFLNAPVSGSSPPLERYFSMKYWEAPPAFDYMNYTGQSVMNGYTSAGGWNGIGLYCDNGTFDAPYQDGNTKVEIYKRNRSTPTSE